MASLYKIQSVNVYKTWFLMSLFFLAFIFLGWLVSAYFNSPIILWVAVAFSIVLNISSYWYSDKIAIKLSGARKIKREEYFDCWNLLENLSISTGMKMPKFYLIDDEAPNAFATGRNEEHSAIVLTKGLIDLLDKNELEGVIAHELSHIRNKDTLIMTTVVVLVGAISIIVDMFLRSYIFGGKVKGSNNSPIFMIMLVISMITIPIVAMVLKMSISRKREYLADAGAGMLTRYPEGLASALEKIKGYKKPMKNIHTATSHLFISDPKGSRKISSYLSGLFSTHPPIDKRIEALRKSI